MLRFDSRVGLGLIATIGGSGCESEACDGVPLEFPPEPDPGPGDPPVVIGGEWLSDEVLELQFSAPIHATGNLDPARFAILSWEDTILASGNQCYEWLDYAELGPGSSYYFYSTPSVADAWIAPEDDTRLRLRLAVVGAGCRLSNGIDGSRGSGVLLVYTDNPGAGPGLLDGDGSELPDLGPQWAIDEFEDCDRSVDPYCRALADFSGTPFEQLATLANIPCP